jgi:hypothetical protein
MGKVESEGESKTTKRMERYSMAVMARDKGIVLAGILGVEVEEVEVERGCRGCVYVDADDAKVLLLLFFWLSLEGELDLLLLRLRLLVSSAVFVVFPLLLIAEAVLVTVVVEAEFM